MVMDKGKEKLGPNKWEEGIIHFDLKPANVLIGRKDEWEHRKLEIFKVRRETSVLRRC